MARIVIAIFILLLPYNAQAITEYHLDLQLLPHEQSLHATAIILPDQSLPSALTLRLADTCVPIDIRQGGQPLDFCFTNGQLKIHLADHSAVSISYRGSFADQPPKAPSHTEDPSYGVDAVISPAGTFLAASADWYPRLETETIAYRVSISTPPGIEAVTSGARLLRQGTSEKNVSVWELTYPLHGLTVSAGNYQVFEDHEGTVPIYAYFYPQTAALAPTYLQQARQYLNLYTELFGPYPFNKFAIVENFFPTGYGFPSWTLLGSSVINLPFIVKTSLGHEIAHSWWGTGIRVDYSQGNWSEGLTTYVADYLFQEMTSSNQALEYRLKILRDYAGLVSPANSMPLDNFLSRTDKASQAIGYGKAAMLFHMLRKQVGDNVFWDTLRQLAQEKLFQQLAWDDIAHFFSKASGQNLAPFFAQWLHRDKGPKLALQQTSIEKTANGYLIQGQIVQSGSVYQLSIDLIATTKSEKIRKQVLVTEQRQPFWIKTTESPLTLSADPDADLFRILSKEEIPPSVNMFRGSETPLVLVAETWRPSQQAQSTLLAALRKADRQIKPLATVTAAELNNHDLLVFGLSESLQPTELIGGKMILPEEDVDIEGKSVFVVDRHPTANNRIVAWFISDDATSDDTVARKIPHYGKYSYLCFEGTEIKIKGTLPSEKSPLFIRFSDQPSTEEEM